MAPPTASRLARLGLLAALLVAAACEAERIEPVVVRLRVAPDSVDFGTLPVGARAHRVVAIINDGNGPWAGSTAAGQGPILSGGAFEIVRPCAVPVAPRSFCEVEIAFVPRTEGEHAGSFTVAAGDGAADGAGDGGRLEVLLQGLAEPADLVVTPAALDFGPVTLGESVRRTFTVESHAELPLDVAAALSGPGFFLQGATSRALHMEPGDTLAVDVDFAPSRGGTHEGAVVLELCGPGCGPAVALTGEGLAPRIEASPRTLAFGEVARGTTAEAALDVTNLGAGDLVITRVDLRSATDDLVLTAPELPLVIAEGASASLLLRYAPTVSRADVDAVLQIRSNDPVSPEVLIPVEGSTAGPGLEMLPRVAHFGALDEGQQRDLDVVLRSTGTVAVDVSEVFIEGAGFSFVPPPATPVLAPGESLLFGVRARATAASVAGGGSAGRVVARADGVADVVLPLAFLSGTAGCQPRAPAPNAVLGSVVVGQGTTGSVTVRNVGDGLCTLEDAREAEGFPFDPGFSFSAARMRTLAPGASAEVELAFRALDLGQRSAFLTLSFFEQPAPLLVSATARGVTGVLTGVPALIEAGPILAGCTTAIRTASFVNRGGDAVVVSRLELEPAGAPFHVELPPLPTRVAAGAVLAVPLTAGAPAAGIYDAELRASADGDVDATVRLKLVVEPPGEPIVETFETPDLSRVDVLFVVDNSLSMADDQSLLADNFDRFIASAFDDGDLSFHVGVTTTDVLGGTGGPLVDGFLTERTSDLAARFASQALVGIEGGGLELGLEAMRRALEDLGSSRNAGFLRDDAALSVIIVSDEEDNGGLAEVQPSLQRPVESYVEALQGLKGGSIANTPVLVSVVVEPLASTRYRAVADAFHGVVLDIGTSTWGDDLSTVGAATFGLRRLFRLGSKPAPDSVSVTVDGAPVTGFTVDREGQAVLLDRAPPPGAVVVISYLGGCG